MEGHVTEFVADSWIAKPCGRSSRSTGRSTPPGLPSRTAEADGWAAAGRMASATRAALTIVTSPETRGALDMAESPWRIRKPLTPPSPRRGEGRGEGTGGSDRDGLVDRHAPLGEALVDAPNHVHVRGEHALGDGTHAAAAQLEAIDGEDRGDLVAAAAEERLVGHVELGAGDVALDALHPERGGHRVDQGGAGDRLQDVARDGRGDELAPAHHEEGRARALRHRALLVQEDRRVVAVGLGLQRGQPPVLVVRAALEPDGDGVVAGALPRGDAAVEAAALRDARPPPGVDVEPGGGGGVET